jgi:20S proteasome alpha/beta subunit
MAHRSRSHVPPKARRPRKRPKAMTLVAAFRCRNNGILLCADRLEDDGIAKRPVDKIWRISGLTECDIFLAGAGLTTIVKDAQAEIETAIRKAVADNRSVLTEHRSLIEDSLKTVHLRHKDDLKRWPLNLLIVIAPRTPGAIPALFTTDRSTLVSEPVYAAHGSGKTISDYLADRLYVHGLYNEHLLTLAAFIFREAERASSGVGLGNDMVLISHGAGPLAFLYADKIKEIEDGIPAIKDAIFSFWRDHLKSPDWLAHYADSAFSKDVP